MTTIRNIWAVFLREMGGYFLLPMAYVVIFLFLVTNGVVFSLLSTSQLLAQHPRQITVIVTRLFGFSLIWVFLLSPLLTMRLFAEEKRSGTLEVLMTAPVTEFQVVLGKFIAAHAFYCLIWLSILPLFVILGVLGKLDWGPVVATYAGIFFLGFLTNSLGILDSALTRNQLVSAAFAISGILLFYLISLGEIFFPEDADVRRLFRYLSFTAHFDDDYSVGVIDVRYFIFYVSFAAFFLFSSVRLLAARKWR